MRLKASELTHSVEVDPHIPQHLDHWEQLKLIAKRMPEGVQVDNPMEEEGGHDQIPSTFLQATDDAGHYHIREGYSCSINLTSPSQGFINVRIQLFENYLPLRMPRFIYTMVYHKLKSGVLAQVIYISNFREISVKYRMHNAQQLPSKDYHQHVLRTLKPIFRTILCLLEHPIYMTQKCKVSIEKLELEIRESSSYSLENYQKQYLPTLEIHLRDIDSRRESHQEITKNLLKLKDVQDCESALKKARIDIENLKPSKLMFSFEDLLDSTKKEYNEWRCSLKFTCNVLKNFALKLQDDKETYQRMPEVIVDINGTVSIDYRNTKKQAQRTGASDASIPQSKKHSVYFGVFLSRYLFGEMTSQAWSESWDELVIRLKGRVGGCRRSLVEGCLLEECLLEISRKCMCVSESKDVKVDVKEVPHIDWVCAMMEQVTTTFFGQED